MLSITEIQALFDQEQRIEITYPEVRKEVLDNLVRFIRPAPGTNFVRYSRVPEPELDTVIHEQIAYFRQFNRPFLWEVYDYDQPASLAERLVAHGFVPDEISALMVLDLHATPASLATPTHHDIRQITSAEQLEPVIEIMIKVWGGDFGWMRRRFADHFAIPNYLHMFVAYVDDQPACAAWVYLLPNTQFASLFGGSTVPEHRGKGLYTALLALRARVALQHGYRFLAIEASPMSQPIVAKHGFNVVGYTHSYKWQAQTHA